MSKYSIDSTTLTSVADAIRTKKGTSDTIQVSDFATEITNLPSGGGDDSTITALPYGLVLTSVVGQTKVCSPSYQSYGSIIIPNSVWTKFSSISFNYSFYTYLRAIYDCYPCQMEIFIAWVNYEESKAWEATYQGFSEYSSKGIISTLITDCEGSVSSTYNIDCTSLTPYSDTRKDLAIIVRLRKKPDTDNPSHLFYVKIGNFEGVKA